MTPSERLLARLRAMGLPIATGAVISRTYAGSWQRRGGAWSWFVQWPIGAAGIGSHYRVAELLAARQIVADLDGDWHVYPLGPGQAAPSNQTHRLTEACCEHDTGRVVFTT